MIMNIDGKQFECPMHGIDYRMTCTRCNELYERFMQTLEEQRMDYGEPEVDNDDKGVPSLLD